MKKVAELFINPNKAMMDGHQVDARSFNLSILTFFSRCKEAALERMETEKQGSSHLRHILVVKVAYALII